MPRGAALCALAHLALLLLSCAALAVRCAADPVTAKVPVPGSAAPALVTLPGGAAAVGNGTRPLLLVLPGFTCPVPREVSDAIPGGPDYRRRTDRAAFAAGFARLAAPLGAITAVLEAPRGARACTLCAQAAAAAAVAPPSWSERQLTLIGAASSAAVVAAGATCLGAWDSTSACCQANPTPAGDVPFILDALRAILAATPAVDARRVYVFGVSAGGFMAWRLGCDSPAGALAGVFILSGGGAQELSQCKPAVPLPLIMLHGKRDLQVPFAGSGPAGSARFQSTEATLAAWARAQRCTPGVPPTRTKAFVSGTAANGTAGQFEMVTFSAGCAASPVEGWWLEQWGHVPPEGDELTGALIAAFRRVSGGA